MKNGIFLWHKNGQFWPLLPNFGCFSVGCGDPYRSAVREKNAAALSERLVQGNSTAEGTGAPPHPPDVSLRGAKRRGNLAVPGSITGKPRRKRNCLPEIATGAKRPRNDKSGSRCHFNGGPFESAALRRARLSAPLHWPAQFGSAFRDCHSLRSSQ